ncbi:MAG: N-6 DNA methylase, partial [Bacteriovoracaceae bacterium]|nr:N-6 DNA methylase [Bacteriovoracaceae bacterium]
MALSKDCRHILQKFVLENKKILIDEFRKTLEGTYGINYKTGKIEEVNTLNFENDKEFELAIMFRARIKFYENDSEGGKIDLIDRLCRELCYTILNRLVALKIFEQKEIILESISSSYSSKGFILFKRVADTSLGDSYETYKAYLISLFEELSSLVSSIFDQQDVFSAFFPREPILLKILSEVNSESISEILKSEESLGWIYQYFNPPEERKLMRDVSSQPRTSRELAVRNQFFTPRYIVDELVQCTIGRLWLSKTQSPEMWISKFPKLRQFEDDISKSELIDPRDIRVIDPACGSMHFGLSSFDLLYEVYIDYWDTYERKKTFGITLSPKQLELYNQYDSKESFENGIGACILEFNLFGVDIDVRAGQVASLALWIKSCSKTISIGGQLSKENKSNIIIAKNFPAESSFFEFLKESVTDELKDYLESLAVASTNLSELGVLVDMPNNGEVALNNVVTLINERIKDYGAQNPDDYYDALIACRQIIDIVKLHEILDKGFHVVLMNPPFGSFSANSSNELKKRFKYHSNNLICTFISRALEVSSDFVGVVLDRTVLIKNSYEKFRKNEILNSNQLDSVYDFGYNVLDANVEVSAVVLNKNRNSSDVHCYDLTQVDSKEKEILNNKRLKKISYVSFKEMPFSAINTEVPDFFLKMVER